MTNKYTKPEKQGGEITTINITSAQKSWVKENNFNLSLFVREKLDDIIKHLKKGKK